MLSFEVDYSYTNTEYPPTPTPTHIYIPFHLQRQTTTTSRARVNYFNDHIISLSDHLWHFFRCNFRRNSIARASYRQFWTQSSQARERSRGTGDPKELCVIYMS
jgi:hypothetical protein